MRKTGAGHAVELDVAIDVARQEVAVDVADDDATFVHGSQIDVNVAGDVEDEIHFDDVAVIVAAALAAAAVFAIAAEGAVHVEAEAAVRLRDVEIDFLVREGERVFRFGARVFVNDEFDLIAGAADDFDRAEDVVDFDGPVLAGEREGFLDHLVVVDGESRFVLVANGGVGAANLDGVRDEGDRFFGALRHAVMDCEIED